MKAISIGCAFGAVLLFSLPAAADQTTDYSAFGSWFVRGNRLSELGWTDAQISAFVAGVDAELRGKGFPLDESAKKMVIEESRRLDEIEARDRQPTTPDPVKLKQYLKAMCQNLHLEQADSGLCYGIQASDRDSRPGPGDTVVIKCAGFAADGKTPLPQFTNDHVRTKISDMLPGLAEGLQMMSIGGKGVFILPPNLSFGAGEWPQGIGRGSPLIFQIMLIDIIYSDSPH